MKQTLVKTGLAQPARKAFTVPIWVLAFIETFSIWQMGVLYYATMDFTIGGVTPLPVSVDKTMAFIVIGYLGGAALSWRFPSRVSLWGRITAAVSLACTVLMFFALPPRLFTALFYICATGCTVFIGVCATLMVNLYSLKTALKDAVIASMLTAPMIALLQNGFFSVNFRTFNICSTLVLALMLIGLSRIPSSCEMAFAARKGSRKAEPAGSPPAPAGLLAGTFFVFSVAALCVLFSATTAETLPHGIFTYYLCAALWAVLFAVLRRRFGIAPMRLYTVLLGMAALGFVFWLLPFPGMAYISLALQSAGYFANFASWFVAGILFEQTGARWIAPLTVVNALAMAAVNSVLVDVLRSSPAILYAVFAGIVLTLLIVYFLTEPFFQRTWMDVCAPKARADTAPQAPSLESDALKLLTDRERDVLPLLAHGYDNAAIAKMLFISENTVKYHIKNIFRKYDVHSRFELTAKVNRSGEA